MTSTRRSFLGLLPLAALGLAVPKVFAKKEIIKGKVGTLNAAKGAFDPARARDDVWYFARECFPERWGSREQFVSQYLNDPAPFFADLAKNRHLPLTPRGHHATRISIPRWKPNLLPSQKPLTVLDFKQAFEVFPRGPAPTQKFTDDALDSLSKELAESMDAHIKESLFGWPDSRISWKP